MSRAKYMEQTTYKMSGRCSTPGCDSDVYAAYDTCCYCRLGRTRTKHPCAAEGCPKRSFTKYCKAHAQYKFRCTYIMRAGTRCPKYGRNPLTCYVHKKYFATVDLMGIARDEAEGAHGGSTSAGAAGSVPT